MSKYALIMLIVGGFIGLLAVLAGAGLLWLSSKEYKPAAREPIALTPPLTARPSRFQPIELYSWNIGYASLGASEDFFMDGGKGVRPAAARTVEENVWAIQAFLAAAAPDIIFLQEVDALSKRSYEVNQAAYFAETWKGSAAFALNFNCPFVPVPFPNPIGNVQSGLLTLSSYGGEAERIRLPTSFTWPERTAQLKRCLLVERVPVQGTGGAGNGETATNAANADKPGNAAAASNATAELVLVNLHLDAFDKGGEGRIAQTKALAEFLKAEYAKGNYCVAGGDFNQVFPALQDAYPIHARETFTPGVVDTSLFGEGWTFAADPAAPSCRALDKPYTGNRDDHQFYLIDGFILSPNVALLAVETQDRDFKNSDHNPVKLTFSLM